MLWLVPGAPHCHRHPRSPRGCLLLSALFADPLTAGSGLTHTCCQGCKRHLVPRLPSLDRPAVQLSKQRPRSLRASHQSGLSPGPPDTRSNVSHSRPDPRLPLGVSPQTPGPPSSPDSRAVTTGPSQHLCDSGRRLPPSAQQKAGSRAADPGPRSATRSPLPPATATGDFPT